MKKFTLISFIVCLSFNFLNAQFYIFSVENDTYVPLEKSISITNNEIWNELNFSIPIGFDFPFYDKLIDSLHANEGSSFLIDNLDLDQDTIVFSAVIPILGEFIDLGFLEGESLSEISYLVEGESGNRICKIEWRNVGFASEIINGTGASSINIQIWLHESDGRIEFRYGESQFDNPFDINNASILIGIVGNFNDITETFDEFILLDGDPAKPSVFYLDEYQYDNYSEFSLDSFPPAGTVYTFRRSVVSTEDIRQLSNDFEILPNPALDVVSLKSKIGTSSIQSVSIYNITGTLINLVDSNYDLIKVSDLNPGIYHLSILTDQGLATKRFVKM